MGNVSQRALEAVSALEFSLDRFRAVLARRHGIAVHDLAVLNSLHLAGGRTTPRDLGSTLGISSGTLTSMLDRLEAIGYIAREPNPHDRRSVLVTISRAGQAAIDDVSQHLLAAIDVAFTVETRPLVTDSLNALTTYLDDTVSMLDN